jgi:hypothetical protein
MGNGKEAMVPQKIYTRTMGHMKLPDSNRLQRALNIRLRDDTTQTSVLETYTKIQGICSFNPTAINLAPTIRQVMYLVTHDSQSEDQAV